MNTIRFTFLAAVTAVSSSFAMSDMSKMVDPALAQDIAEFTGKVGKKLHKAAVTLDDDGDGKLEYKTMLRTMMGRGFARINKDGPVAEGSLTNGMTAEDVHKNNAEFDKTISSFMKPDTEGMVGEAEFAGMFSNAIYQYGIGRNLSLDVDKDLKLSLKEYATGFPIRKGQETDEEGFTTQQREGFKTQDLDGNGYIEGKEWMPPAFYHTVEEVAELLAMVLGMGILDADSDNTVTKAELAAFLPEAKELPESFPMSMGITYIRAMDHDDMHALADAMLAKL